MWAAASTTRATSANSPSAPSAPSTSEGSVWGGLLWEERAVLASCTPSSGGSAKHKASPVSHIRRCFTVLEDTPPRRVRQHRRPSVGRGVRRRRRDGDDAQAEDGHVVGHAAAPHDVALLGEEGEGRVGVLVERERPRGAAQRRGELVEALAGGAGPSQGGGGGVAVLPGVDEVGDVVDGDVVEQAVRGEDDEVVGLEREGRHVGVCRRLERVDRAAVGVPRRRSAARGGLLVVHVGPAELVGQVEAAELLRRDEH
mmetsp:Transcript_27716/g.110991  ORF Transcript_27716/g.110991 Transcript_27716/m.110991 type:complete len:256 (-) Transcript_27716:201-968(-)